LQIDLKWKDKKKRGMKVSFRTAIFAQKGKASDKARYLIDPLLLVLKQGFLVDDCKQFRGHCGYAPDDSERGNSCFIFIVVLRNSREMSLISK